MKKTFQRIYANPKRGLNRSGGSGPTHSPVATRLYKIWGYMNPDSNFLLPCMSWLLLSCLQWLKSGGLWEPGPSTHTLDIGPSKPPEFIRFQNIEQLRMQRGRTLQGKTFSSPAMTFSHYNFSVVVVEIGV